MSNQNDLIQSALIRLGFNTRSNNLPSPELLATLPGDEIGISAYNNFLLDYSASGYDVDRNSQTRLDIFLYGLVEEWGEFQGIMKRVLRGDRSFDDSLDSLRLELGDFLAYLVLLASTIKISDETVRLANLVDILAHLMVENKELMCGMSSVMVFPRLKRINLMSRKITKIIGKINDLYEEIELVPSISVPGVKDHYSFLITDCLSELLLYISVLANILSCNLGHIAFLNYRKLYQRQQRGTQYGSGDNR